MEPIETSDATGVDYAWVMQVTFVLTIVVGAPIVALLSTAVSLPTWAGRAEFALRVGAVIWVVTAIGTFAYARYRFGLDDDEGTDIDDRQE